MTHPPSVALAALLLLSVSCRSNDHGEAAPADHSLEDAAAGAAVEGQTAVEATSAAEAGAGSSRSARSVEEPAGPYSKPGFFTREVDGRLWVFRTGTDDLAEFLLTGEPAKSVTLIGVGPNGMTMRSSDKETIRSYLYSSEDFDVHAGDGRMWVLARGTEDHAAFLAGTEPAKSVTLVGAGPAGETLRGIDRETLVAFVTRKAGFHTVVVDERLWVFRTGSPELADFLAGGEPAKSVTLVGAGPMGMTLRGGDRETLDAYVAAD